MSQEIDLSIIIVSWRVRDLLEKCLTSIFTQTPNLSLEVFVVENNSLDRSAEMVRKEFPQVKLINNQENLGFSKANNQALKLAKGKYVLFLNPDTEILGNTLEKMVYFMEQNPACGAAGCQILNPDGSLQPSIRCFPRFLDQAAILLKIYPLAPNLGVFRRYLAKNTDYSQKQEVEQIMGAFFMIKKEVAEKIGFLDEKFWIWFEEVDYCQRIKRAGWKILYNPEAKIIHHFGQSFKHFPSVKKQRLLNKSLLYYFKKYHSFPSYLALYLISPISLFLSFLVQIFAISNDKWRQRT